MSTDDLIQALNERAEEFCRWLFPQGTRAGNYWQIGNIQGEPGDSLKINVEGEMLGVWKDWANGDENMKGGNLLQLLMQVRRTTNSVKCIHEAKVWLGVPISDEEDHLFRQTKRNYGKFETPCDTYEALHPDGPVYRYLTQERKLTDASIRLYRVCQRAGLAAVGFPHFDETGKKLVAVKVRDVAKHASGERKAAWWDPKGAVQRLWGKPTVPEDETEIVITEGEIDTMTLHEIGFSAVSMPGGAGDMGWIERDWKWLERFASIILCYDNDAAGQSGLDRAFPALVSRLGRHRCRIARLPDGIKDPNDALQQDRASDLFEAIQSAQSIDPAPLRHISEYRNPVRDLIFPPEDNIPGFPLPWTDRLRLRPAEVTLWTGISGHGKTTALLHCIAHLAHVHGQRAILACMEAPAKKSGVILCHQTAGYDLKSVGAFEKVFDRVQENLWVYDYVGTAPWKDLIDTFRYAWRRYGVTQFVIDSVMTTDIDTDDYNQQSAFIGAICKFAEECNGHIHVVAHSRKNKDEEKAPGKFDVAGHANLTNRAFNGLTVFRNKAKVGMLKDAYESKSPQAISNAHAEHDAELVCWKQRETGDEFHIPLWFHKASLQFWAEVNPVGKSYMTKG